MLIVAQVVQTYTEIPKVHFAHFDELENSILNNSPHGFNRLKMFCYYKKFESLFHRSRKILHI